MRRVSVLLGAMMLASAGPAMAQPDRDSSNAAAWYRRAHDRYSALEFTNDEWKAVWEFENDPGRGPTDEVRHVIDRFRPAAQLALLGSRLQRCDFKTDFSAGLFARQDHFTKTATLVKLMRDDYLLTLFDGDVSGAIDRLCGMYRMAAHCGNQRTIVSSLVGSAMLSYADGQTELALQNGAIDPLEAGELLRSLNRIDQQDPFNYAKAVAHEREITTQWMLDRYGGADGMARLAEDRDRHKLPESLVNQLGGSATDLNAALKSADLGLKRVATAFAMSDASEARHELAAIDAEMTVGTYGPLARDMLSSCIRSYPARTKSQEQLKARLAQMKAIADGTLDPRQFANAAVWYLRAIRAMHKIPPERMALVRQYAGEHRTDAAPDLAETLTADNVRAIIDQLRDAVGMAHCDFSSIRPRWPAALTFDQAGMRDLVRLLHADTARLVHTGDYDSAVDRLRVCSLMIAQLAHDKAIGSALVAHDSFLATDQMVFAAIDGRMFSDEQIHTLAATLEKFDRGEPFPYRSAMTQLRFDLQHWAVHLYGGQQSDELSSKARQLLGRFDGDALLWMAVIRDRADADSSTAARRLQDDLAPLEGVVSLPAFEQALREAAEVQRHLERAEYDDIAPEAHPTIAPLAMRMAEAGADFIQAQQRWRPPVVDDRPIRTIMTGRPPRSSP